MKNAIVTGKVTTGKGVDQQQSVKIEFELNWDGVEQKRADDFLNDFAKIRVQDSLRRTMTHADLLKLPEGTAAGTRAYKVNMAEFFNGQRGTVSASKAVEVIASSGDEEAIKAAIAVLQAKAAELKKQK
jgi:hypothetical protein